VPEPQQAAIARHPHLAVPRRDGCVRVDLHSHTMWSGDSTTTPDEIERAVIESGLDVLCLTDHSAIKGAVELAPRLEALGCRVVIGEEMKTQAGELIGLFLTERIPAGTTAVEAAQRIREQGGVVYVPHPFDPMRRNLAEPALYELAELGLLDAVEVFNAKTSLSSLNRRAAEFAAEFDLPGGAGSDAHVPDALGAAFVEMAPFGTAAEFMACLRAATVVGHHWDQPRPWTPRIVPSVSLE
jgi:predicted metal-dependent phosphoesterase TrpH